MPLVIELADMDETVVDCLVRDADGEIRRGL